MRYLSLFSGIEAATAAWHPLGWECAAVSEIEPFPCAVLKHHYPDVPNLGDVTKITEEDIKALGHIDVVVFGSPCQDLSVAGHRKGLINADGTVTRSGLFFTAINIARWSGARFWLWENVPGAFSSNKGRDFAAVVEFMAGLDEVPVPAKGWGTEGVAVGDNGLLEWGVLDAQWFGVAQRRRRVFVIADLGDWSNRPPILIEPESLRRDTPPSREAVETVAGCTQPSIASGKPNVGTLMANAGTKLWLGNQEALSGDYHIIQPVTHSLRGEGFDASEDGTGRGTPLVPVPMNSGKDYKARETDIAQPLMAGGPVGGNQGGDFIAQPMAYGIRTANTSSNGWGIQDEVTHTLDQAMGVAVAIGRSEELAASVDLAGTLQRGGAGGRHDGVMTTHAVVGTLCAEDSPHGARGLTGLQTMLSGHIQPVSNMRVRRLTPVECERLQGFPDNYTMIPWRKKPAEECPDGPRYKALGNSMAVPVMRWIGNQIQKAIDHENKSTPAHQAA